MAGVECSHRQPERRPPARHRHGLSAFLSVRGADGRENIALSMDRSVSLARVARKRHGCRASMACARSEGACRRSLGRRKAADRNRRALLQNPQLIILDEPTSVLTPQEADGLFETLQKLRSEGVPSFISVIVSRKAAHLRPPTVLRHGKVTGACDPRAETPASLARMMVGSDVAVVTPEGTSTRGDVQLEARHLSVAARTPFAVSLKNICQGQGRRGARDRRSGRQRAERALRCAFGRISGRRRQCHPDPPAAGGDEEHQCPPSDGRPVSCRRSAMGTPRSRRCRSPTISCSRAANRIAGLFSAAAH